MSAKVTQIANAIYSELNPKSTNAEIANRMQAILGTTITTTVAEGFSKQIAVIEVLELLHPLLNKYSFLIKEDLDFGIGEQFMTFGWKQSVPSATDTNTWLPEGDLESLDRFESFSVGVIERKVRNDYSAIDMRERVRNSATFGKLVMREMVVGYQTKQRERRENSRFLFGINNNIVAQEYKNQLLPVKNLIHQNVKEVTTTTTYKSVVDYLRVFNDIYYSNMSNEYNAANKPNNTTGNQWINGVDTGVKLLMNTAIKEDTVLVVSSAFVNGLKQELGNVFNPKYWEDFTKDYGHVIIDTFSERGDIFIIDKNTVGFKSMFDEYTNVYYPDKSAFHTLTKWREHWYVIPYKNCIKFSFTITAPPAIPAAGKKSKNVPASVKNTKNVPVADKKFESSDAPEVVSNK